MNDGMIKSDVRGRLHYSREQKSALVQAFKTSGLSGPRFAALHGVKYQTLASWIQRRKRVAAVVSPGLPCPAFLSLVPAELEAAAVAGAGRAMEVLLPGGAKLVITAPGQVQLAVALIRALENPRPC